VSANAEQTSAFGSRLDPFLGRPAYHTGIDFREATGAPVFAAAPGKVTAAGSNGGYGLAVEIDHGNGLTTRYAHLSAVLVAEGQTVDARGLIGRIGSTGRSTGPHLHYEIRIDDEPVDPARFLRAGERLASHDP
jgi:murein DD-endopeptidase MepM/ murein hydrolase activator NlpD